MPVLTKINTNSIAEDAITGDKFAGDAYIANSTTQNITGTYTENRLYTSDAYTLSGNATINSHITLSTVKPTGDVVLTAGGAYTLTGTGVLSGGSLLAKVNTDASTLTGELGSAVTGGSGLTSLGTVTSGTFSGTLGSGVNFDAMLRSKYSWFVGRSTNAGTSFSNQLITFDVHKFVGTGVRFTNNETINITTAGLYWLNTMLTCHGTSDDFDYYYNGAKLTGVQGGRHYDSDSHAYHVVQMSTLHKFNAGDTIGVLGDAVNVYGTGMMSIFQGFMVGA